MITYELRTSDGTHTTLAGVITSIKALWPSSMDDITVNVEGGATFGTVTGDNAFGAATTGWNGKTVIFQTKESERATPATLLGSWSTTGGSATGAYGYLNFYCIRLGYESGSQAMFNEGATHARISLRNCVVVLRTSSFGFWTNNLNDTTVNNSTFLISGISAEPSGIPGINSGGLRTVRNNIECAYKLTTITGTIVSSLSFGAYGLFYYYGRGTIDSTTEPTDIINQDPKFVEVPFATGTDTVSDILAKNIRLQSDSPCVGTAETATAESIDILGNSRA